MSKRMAVKTKLSEAGFYRDLFQLLLYSVPPKLNSISVAEHKLMRKLWPTYKPRAKSAAYRCPEAYYAVLAALAVKLSRIKPKVKVTDFKAADLLKPSPGIREE